MALGSEKIAYRNMKTESIPGIIFHFGFGAYLVSGLAFVLGITSSVTSAAVVVFYAVACIVATGIYLVGLGLVAYENRRFWFGWIAASVVLWPIAPVVCYFALLILGPRSSGAESGNAVNSWQQGPTNA